jgi:hypothetical protein
MKLVEDALTFDPAKLKLVGEVLVERTVSRSPTFRRYKTRNVDYYCMRRLYISPWYPSCLSACMCIEFSDNLNTDEYFNSHLVFFRLLLSSIAIKTLTSGNGGKTKGSHGTKVKYNINTDPPKRCSNNSEIISNEGMNQAIYCNLLFLLS